MTAVMVPAFAPHLEPAECSAFWSRPYAPDRKSNVNVIFFLCWIGKDTACLSCTVEFEFNRWENHIKTPCTKLHKDFYLNEYFPFSPVIMCAMAASKFSALCTFTVFTSLYNPYIHHQSHLLGYILQYPWKNMLLTLPSWSLRRVLLPSVAQTNRTRLSSSIWKQKSFILWSKNREVWAPAAEHTLSHKDCGWGCFLGISAAGEEAELLWDLVQLLRLRLQIAAPRAAALHTARHRRHLELSAGCSVSAQSPGAEGTAQPCCTRNAGLKGQVRGLWMRHPKNKGNYMKHKGRG